MTVKSYVQWAGGEGRGNKSLATPGDPNLRCCWRWGDRRRKGRTCLGAPGGEGEAGAGNEAPKPSEKSISKTTGSAEGFGAGYRAQDRVGGKEVAPAGP